MANILENVVQFPGLGLEFTLNNVAFTVFGLPIMWYGVIITGGIILAVAFALTQCKSFGVDGDRMIDVVLIGIVCGVLGARLFYIAFFDEYGFANFFNFRSGGLAIYGGIIGAFISIPFSCRWRKVPMLPMADLAAMGFLIGQGIGRWGNFFNQEAFGSNTTAPWGMYSQTTYNYLASHQAQLAAQGITVDPSMPVHPTFLYESIWCLLGFLLLFLYSKHRRFNGEIALFYVIWYGLGRFWIEGLRTDSLMINSLNIPVSQLIAATSVLVGVAIWVFAKVKTRGKPLMVPALPEKQYRVKLDGELVTITLPGGSREPSKAAKLALAREQLEAEQQTKEKPVEIVEPEEPAETQIAEPVGAAAEAQTAEDVTEEEKGKEEE